MSNILSDAEKMNSGGGNQGSAGGLMQDAEKMGGGQQSGGNNQSSGMDKTVDQGVDKLASEEGVPSAADGTINKEVNSEVSNFS
ncbi:hypothetical protein MMC28_007786 [Mycoblastus sanguinarius]|nr:hypothetical protein [Mycoblastus sanguinarius]